MDGAKYTAEEWADRVLELRAVRRLSPRLTYDPCPVRDNAQPHIFTGGRCELCHAPVTQ